MTRDEKGDTLDVMFRRRALVAILASTLLSLLLLRQPLLAVPSLEAGWAVGALAALLGAWLAQARARRRPAPSLRFGLLDQTPGEAVVAELTWCFRVLALVVAIPLGLLSTHALSTGCRVLAGWPAFLLITLPAGLGGSCFGVLLGSWSRRRKTVALGALGLLFVSLVATLAEAWVGPRTLVHDLLLGPLTASAIYGHDRSLGLPTTVYLHRALAVIVFVAAAALAALLRCRLDLPEVDDENEEETESSDDGWSRSRLEGPARVRFLLNHHRRGPRHLLVLIALLALPFLLNPDASGLTAGRGRLHAHLDEVIETEHFRIHHAGRGPGSVRMEQVVLEHEWAHAQVSEWLGIQSTEKVDTWLHPDEDTLHSLTGARGFIYSAPWNRELHVVTGPRGIPGLRHELIHVMAADFGLPPIGTSISLGFIEGLAVAHDEGFAEEADAHAGIAALARIDRLPSATTLMHPLGLSGSHADLAYRASGSFIGWLYQQHGPEPLRRAYPLGRFEKVYGRDLATLDAEWRRFLLEEVDCPPALAARAQRRFDPRRRRPLHQSACARLGRAEVLDPSRRANWLSRAGLHDEAADAHCEAFILTSDARELSRASAERWQAGDAAAALELLDRALAMEDDVDRLLRLRRRRAALLAVSRRPDDAAAELRRAAIELGAPEGWPQETTTNRDPLIELLGLELDALGSDEPGRLCLAAGLDGWSRMAARLGAIGQVEELPLLASHLLLEGSRSPSGRALQADADRAVTFARRAPGTPELAASHLLRLAATALRLDEGELGRHLLAVTRELPLRPLTRRRAEELGARVAFAETRDPAQPPRSAADGLFGVLESIADEPERQEEGPGRR
ncbi:MAG: hypothetical protein AAF533_22140 [Acidobacteriota bacterium]